MEVSRMKGLLGRKIGMTQVFTTDGELIPVTVIEATPNVVLQVVGHCKKANTSPKRFIREVRDADMEVQVGDLVKVDIFEAGETVDVIGTSKGKGYQGTIVRNNAHMGPRSHGSMHHRHIGSLATNGITSRQGRIMKGTVMAGQEGGYRTTNQNLTVVSVDVENNYVLIKGNVPGPKKGFVMIRTAKTSKGNKAPVELVNYAKEAPVEEVQSEEVQ